MAVLGKSQSANTANAKGKTSNLLIDTVSFLELFNVRLEKRETINYCMIGATSAGEGRRTYWRQHDRVVSC